MRIEEIDALPREDFAEALGWVFEGSQWVAERTWERRPFGTRQALHAAMAQVVANAAREEQLALLRAHPDLGARAAMSSASVGEQAGARLDRLTAEEYERLRRLNAAYRAKFGFPFLLAVKGASIRDILEGLERRLGAGPEEEFGEALAQVYRIALFRLEEMIA